MTVTAREQGLLSNTDVLGYIQTRNATRNEQAKAEGCTFWTTMPEDAEFVSRFKNVYELEHMYACGTYSDVYKETYFGRPTHSYGEWTLEVIEAEIDAMCSYAERELLEVVS